MSPLATSLFEYDLPAHLIAQVPAVRRDASRLLVVDRRSREVAHRTFADLPAYLRSGDVLLRNNAAVLPARLYAQRPTGGAVECLLLRPLADKSQWRCLVRPGRRLRPGARFHHAGGEFAAQIVSREDDGTAVVQFEVATGESVIAIANRLGEMPLPPYISRPSSETTEAAAFRGTDRERYQTVYADRDRQVAVAAPTAGLHFTPELLAQLGHLGVRTADVTLQVGLGTFQPMSTTTVEEHVIHREVYEIPPATQAALLPPWRGRRIAVGTTTVRAVEDFLDHVARPVAGSTSWIAEAAIFLHPPREFRGIDALITNFHQPRSTLLCLVAAFLAPGSTDGIAWLKQIYQEAIAREYRFFSYGDAMLIL